MSKLMDAVLEFEDAMRDNIKAHEERHQQQTAALQERIVELHNEGNGLRERVKFLEQQLSAANRVSFANRQGLEVKLTDFLQKNEALRAENAKLRTARDAIAWERDDAKACAADYFRAMALVHERHVNDERDLPTILRALFGRLDELRDEYANRGAIIQELAKREHEHQQKVAGLEKILSDVEGLGSLTTATALQWKANYERQMAINARQRSRIGELRLQLHRIARGTFETLWGVTEQARFTLAEDDRAAEKPITEILTQEAP